MCEFGGNLGIGCETRSKIMILAQAFYRDEILTDSREGAVAFISSVFGQRREKNNQTINIFAH